jgi:hypothetical protein
LPALFGKGLKKNIIYDLIHNNQIQNIPLNSSFQWYNLDWLKKDIEIIINNKIQICNLFTEPIETKEIIRLFKKIYNIDYEFHIEYYGNNNRIEYNTQTIYDTFFDSKKIGYICDNLTVLHDIEELFKFNKLDKSKLCVSNICIDKIPELQFSSLLKLYGISKVQIAPTKKIGNWNNIDMFDVSIFTNNGIQPYSLQSIAYGLDNLNIFSENKDQLIKHIKNVIDLASKHKIEVLVFGCPKNRKIVSLEMNNDDIFIDFFKQIGEYCNDKNVIICIENNSKKYNCNYINTIEECEKLVRQINNSNIKMMVDLGNAVMETDEWYYLSSKKDIIYNIDISNPFMSDFSVPHESAYIFKAVLKQNLYNKNINLEMLIKEENELEILNKSLNNFINIFSN